MKREIEEKLRTWLGDTSNHNVILVEGARQVGKSYLVNRVLKSQPLPFFSFDLEKDRKLRRQIDQTGDFNDFKTLMVDGYGIKNRCVLFFDEAQESPQLAQYVKSFKEDWPGVRVVLTGSSMKILISKKGSSQEIYHWTRETSAKTFY